MSEKNVKTIFCDIDGTLIRQVAFNELDENQFEVLPGAREKFREWITAGHHIVKKFFWQIQILFIYLFYY